MDRQIKSLWHLALMRTLRPKKINGPGLLILCLIFVDLWFDSLVDLWVFPNSCCVLPDASVYLKSRSTDMTAFLRQGRSTTYGLFDREHFPPVAPASPEFKLFSFPRQSRLGWRCGR